MRDLIPPFSTLVAGEKGREGNSGSSVDHHRIHIPTTLSRAQRPPRWWGNVRGTLEGWGCYIRPARGGESSVRPRGAYRLHCDGWHTIVRSYSAANRRSASCTRGMHTTQLSLPLPRRAGKALEDSDVCGRCCGKTTLRNYEP